MCGFFFSVVREKCCYDCLESSECSERSAVCVFLSVVREKCC